MQQGKKKMAYMKGFKWNKSCLITFLLMMASLTYGVPAKRGVWQQLRLKDGTIVKAELRGDEKFHYWQTADGTYIMYQDNGYTKVEDINIRMARQKSQRAQARSKRSDIMGEFHSYTGKKRALLLLVEFTDRKFRSDHDITFYENVANKIGFTSEEGYKGSVHDYFLDQSSGLFDLTFDVVGPISLSHDYAYYGKNNKEGYDMRAGEMVAEAAEKADSKVNYADYDWNGDGEVELVMVIFAGKSENNGGGENAIWPHEWELYDSDYDDYLKLDDTTLNVYACANEIDGNYSSGIGTICHEFSHGLGLADMYDLYGSNYGMGRWSIMDGGSFNGNCYCPAGFTSFEKMSCGWLEPIMLNNDTIINNMSPLSSGGDAYLLQNEGWKNEYYLLENRQQTGWDASLPGKGLLIVHVDFNANYWALNLVNSPSMSGHLHCSIFHADNSTKNEGTDPYPIPNNNKLTAISEPAATLFKPNADGTLFMSKSITKITQNTDGTVGFTVGPQKYEAEVDWIITPKTTTSSQHSTRIYSLEGRFIGTDQTKLKSGVYLIDGKKVVK